MKKFAAALLIALACVSVTQAGHYFRTRSVVAFTSPVVYTAPIVAFTQPLAVAGSSCNCNAQSLSMTTVAPLQSQRVETITTQRVEVAPQTVVTEQYTAPQVQQVTQAYSLPIVQRQTLAVVNSGYGHVQPFRSARVLQVRDRVRFVAPIVREIRLPSAALRFLGRAAVRQFRRGNDLNIRVGNFRLNLRN